MRWCSLLLLLVHAGTCDSQASPRIGSNSAPSLQKEPSSILEWASAVTGSRLQWRLSSNDDEIMVDTLGDNNHRHLQGGDFDSLNNLFHDATIAIPQEFSTGALTVRNLQCKNLELANLILEATSSEDIAETAVANRLPVITELDMEIVQLDFTCTLDYEFDIPVLPNIQGSATLTSLDNAVRTEFQLTSSTTSNQPQITVTLGDCKADMSIDNVDLTTVDFLDDIMDSLLGLVDDAITPALGGMICDEMTAVADQTLPDVLEQVTALLGPYLLQAQDASLFNPLSTEETAPLDKQEEYINFQNTSSSENPQVADLAQFVLDAIDMVDALLSGQKVENDNGTMAINEILRDWFLDDSGAFVWDLTTQSSPSMAIGELFGTNDVAQDETKSNGQGMTVLSSHDPLLQMMVSLDQVQLRGLDSMTQLETFKRIGKQTLQNSLAWKHLSGTAKFTFKISPSTLDDSLWSSVPPGKEVVEQVDVSLGADDIHAVLSIFLAINQNKLGQVPLGSLFQSDTAASCILSTLYQAHLISGFDVAVSNLIDVNVTGFSDAGLDRVLTETMDLIYNLYEHWFIKAIPNFAETTLRNTTNDMWSDFVSELQSDHSEACPLVDLPGQEDGHIAYMDFRDLLLPAAEALTSGGTGQEPYGDIVSIVFDLIQKQLLEVDENDSNKRLRLNSLVLDPLTLAQSGSVGTLRFQSNLATFVAENANKAVEESSSLLAGVAASLFDYFELRLYDTRIQNIDTVLAPVTVLRPSSENPHLLENKIQFGPVPDKPLNASVRVSVSIASDASPEVPTSDSGAANTPIPKDTAAERIDHEIDISISATSLGIVADIIAMVDAGKLQRFPLQDIANPFCWLATIPAPPLDEQGKVVVPVDDSNGPQGLKLDAFVTEFSNLTLDAQCVNEACAKGGFGALMTLTDIWQKSNVTTTLGERYEGLASELLTGDYVNSQIARWLEEAPMKCPHSEDSNAVLTEYPALEMPALSPQSIDTLVFTALTAAQAVLLVVSETPSVGQGAETTISSSKSEKRLIDFSSTDSGVETLADLISFLFSQASEMLGQQSASKPESDANNIGINNIISGMLNEDGVLDLNFEGTNIIEGSNLQLQLNSLRVRGLDTFTEFSILDAAGPQLLHNSIRMAKLAAEIDMDIVSGSGDSSSNQRIVLSFAAEGINASIPVFAAIDADILDVLELGSLLEIDRILPCVFTAVEDMHVPWVSLSVRELTDVTVQGLFPATSDAFSRSMSAITEQFDIGIDGFLNPVISAVLNGLLSFYKNNAECLNVMLPSQATRRRTQAEESSPSFVDFRDLFLPASVSAEYGGSGTSPYGDLFRTILDFVEELVLKVDPKTQLSAVNNQLIGPITKASSNVTGSIIMAGSVIDHVQKLQIGGLDAAITFRASDARIDNLDTMGSPISLLAPVPNEPQYLNNTATLGVTADRPLRLSIRLLFGIEDDDTHIRNDMELSLDLQAANMILTALINLVEKDFATFPLGDILKQDCWLAKIPAPPLDEYGFRKEGVKPSAALYELAASVAKMDMTIVCHNCTSPGLKYFDAGGSLDLAPVMNDLINYVTDLLEGKFLQLQIDRALNNAAKRCPHSPEYDPNFELSQYATFESSHEPSMAYLLMILIVTGILLAFLFLIILSRRCIVRARHRRLLRSLPDRELYLLQKEQEQEDKREAELNAVTRSLFQSSGTIPAYVRYLMPLVILANMGLFLSGHLSLGATVNIQAQIAGEYFQVDGFFSFSMAQSTIDIWNAGGKALAALIFIFSGLWPYTKCIMTLVLWFIPPSRVCMATRGKVLLWLDTLAKWSMVDIFVLLVSVAGFRVSIVSPNVDFLPDNFYSVDLIVQPLLGLWMNMIAQLFSQISSHIIIHWHRRVVDKSVRAHRALFRKTADYLRNDDEGGTQGFLDERRDSSSTSSSVADGENEGGKDRLCRHAFVRPHSENNKLVARAYVNPLIIIWSLSLTALLIAGCVLPSFSIEVLGIMGVLVESGNEWREAIQEYSVFTITELLMDQAAIIQGVKDNIGLGSLSALLVFTVLIVPILQTMALLYHWFAPMNKKTRRRMEVLLEIAQAWQYVEVYLAATVVAAWQLGPVSEFMINSYCSSLDETFSMLVYYGILKESDAQCFRVEAGIESAAYILAVVAVLLALLNTYIGNASRQYFRDTENKSTLSITPASRSVASSVMHYDDRSSGPGKSLNQPRGGGSLNGADNVFDDEDADWGEGDPLKKPAFANGEHQWQRSHALEKIHPVPVLFTDKFRWTLIDEPGAPAVESVSKEGLPTVDDDTDPSESQSLFMKGDAPHALGSPYGSQGEAIAEEEDAFEDEHGVRLESLGGEEGWESADDNSLKKDRIIKMEDLEEYWESGDEENSNSFGVGRDRSIATASDNETYAMDQSQSTRMSEYHTARDADNAVLLGSGNLVLRANPPRNEAFEDELETVNDDDADDDSFVSDMADDQEDPLLDESRPRPQGHSLLQAAFLEDKDGDGSLPPLS